MREKERERCDIPTFAAVSAAKNLSLAAGRVYSIERRARVRKRMQAYEAKASERDDHGDGRLLTIHGLAIVVGR